MDPSSRSMVWKRAAAARLSSSAALVTSLCRRPMARKSDYSTRLRGGGLAECTLPPGGVSAAVTHRTIEEIWLFTEGRGQVWRRQGDLECVTDVSPGVSLTIPLSTHFQFRNTGDGPLRFVISTMPPWPGEDEAPRVPDYWPLP